MHQFLHWFLQHNQKTSETIISAEYQRIQSENVLASSDVLISDEEITKSESFFTRLKTRYL